MNRLSDWEAGDNWMINPTDIQTDKQRDKQTDKPKVKQMITWRDRR